MNLMFSELGFSLYVHWVWSDIVCSTEQMESLLPVNLYQYAASVLYITLDQGSTWYCFAALTLFHSLPLTFFLLFLYSFCSLSVFHMMITCSSIITVSLVSESEVQSD